MLQVSPLDSFQAVTESLLAAQDPAPSDTSPTEGVAELIDQLGVPPEYQWKILVSVVVVFILWLIRHLILRVVDRRTGQPRVRYQWAKGTAYVAFLLGIVFVGQVWLEGLQQMGTFLGLLTAGLAIALKDLVANLAGWVFIVWRRPFELGDRIQIGEHAGDVVDIRIFQFTMLEIGNWVDADQSTGRIIHVPNAQLFSEQLANYTADFEYLWNEIPVLVTFESDWRKARRILEGIARETTADLSEEAERAMRRASRKVLIYYTKLTSTVYTTVKDSGVLLTIRYLCKPRARRGTAQEIWERILDAFAAEPDVDLAYPTRRVYNNMLEGKEQARAAVPTLRIRADRDAGDDLPVPEDRAEDPSSRGRASTSGRGVSADRAPDGASDGA